MKCINYKTTKMHHNDQHYKLFSKKQKNDGRCELFSWGFEAAQGWSAALSIRNLR